MEIDWMGLKQILDHTMQSGEEFTFIISDS